MATFNGMVENLKFSCGYCGGSESIEVNLRDANAGGKLIDWLWVHSAKGGTYENVPVTKPSGNELNLAQEPYCSAKCRDASEKSMISHKCPKCGNLGVMPCYCGGDLCVCDNHGEEPCPKCGGD